MFNENIDIKQWQKCILYGKMEKGYYGNAHIFSERIIA